jgi:hypothetical protein
MSDHLFVSVGVTYSGTVVVPKQFPKMTSNFRVHNVSGDGYQIYDNLMQRCKVAKSFLVPLLSYSKIFDDLTAEDTENTEKIRAEREFMSA